MATADQCESSKDLSKPLKELIVKCSSIKITKFQNYLEYFVGRTQFEAIDIAKLTKTRQVWVLVYKIWWAAGSDWGLKFCKTWIILLIVLGRLK